MAFVWDEPTQGAFWMKDTLIPLSVAFWDEDGRIVGIVDMEPCATEPCPTYASPAPYVEKWREAMRYLDADRPYQKIWWELQAMAWNRPEYQPRIAGVLAAWRDAMRGAVAEALQRYRLADGPLGTEEWITLVVALNEGIILERLAGITHGHDALLAAIDRWLGGLEQRAAEAPVVGDAPEDAR